MCSFSWETSGSLGNRLMGALETGSTDAGSVTPHRSGGLLSSTVCPLKTGGPRLAASQRKRHRNEWSRTEKGTEKETGPNRDKDKAKETEIEKECLVALQGLPSLL